ncbi:MAG: glycosyltransferase, partial [Deltaproteobacteria bacterium]|nr:glycosyltransferase [Deltaproteobacteria bacterium]
RVKIIKFRKNFGKSIALNEGFRIADGDIIFTMDADLQDDPENIEKFILKLNEGFDMVSGWKQKRKDPILSKKLPSKIFNFVISKFTGWRPSSLHPRPCPFQRMEGCRDFSQSSFKTLWEIQIRNKSILSWIAGLNHCGFYNKIYEKTHAFFWLDWHTIFYMWFLHMHISVHLMAFGRKYRQTPPSDAWCNAAGNGMSDYYDRFSCGDDCI